MVVGRSVRNFMIVESRMVWFRVFGWLVKVWLSVGSRYFLLEAWLIDVGSLCSRIVVHLFKFIGLV